MDISHEKGRMRRRLLKETMAINNQKLDKFAQYETQRVTANGFQVAPPIYQDKKGQIHWLNRAARRKLKK